ncbi:MAG: hypothetical protein P8074_05165 [Anaerolineales bacterium]|jgi:hypothetical protein
MLCPEKRPIVIDGANVVSNDRFEKYSQRFEWIEEQRVPLMIFNGEVELYEPKLENST